jgi:hypothetical protein
LTRKRATVFDYPDGRLAIWHGGIDLPYSTFDKLRRVNQAAIVDNKRLGAALTMIQEMQAAAPQRRRNAAEPNRRAQPRHLFPT